MPLLHFPDNWIAFFNSCSGCTNFNPTAELVISAGTQTNEGNEEIEMQPVKISKCLTLFYILTCLFMHFTD